MQSETPELPVRQLLVDLSQGFARHWHGDDPYRSHLYNSLSLLFPLGEQNFIEVARACLPLLRQDQLALAAQVQGFIGQEAAHRHLHAQYNAQLAAQGYRDRIGAALAWRIERTRRLPLLTRMAVVAAFEHVAAVLGDGVLRHPSWSADMQEPLQTVWRWHAAEEAEHKAVAFDLYRALGGGYARRVGWFLYATLIFLGDTLRQTSSMLRQDGALLQPRTWSSAMRTWWGHEGIAWHLLPRLLHYLSPRFHPAQQDSSGLVERWRREYAAAYRVVGAAAEPDGARKYPLSESIA